MTTITLANNTKLIAKLKEVTENIDTSIEYITDAFADDSNDINLLLVAGSETITLANLAWDLVKELEQISIQLEQISARLC